MAEAAEAREEAGKRALEDEETLRQMRQVRVDFDTMRDDENGDPDIADEGGDREVMELQEFDEEDPHYSQVSSNYLACHVLER